jgi:hypothetical protein
MSLAWKKEEIISYLQLILVQVAELPHLAQLMPGRAERVLKLQDFNLEITHDSSANCAVIHTAIGVGGL